MNSDIKVLMIIEFHKDEEFEQAFNASINNIRQKTTCMELPLYCYLITHITYTEFESESGKDDS